MMLMQCELLNSPQSAQIHQKSDKLTPSCLRFSLSSMKKTRKYIKGRGVPITSGERGGKRKKHFFFKANKCLGCLSRSACLRSVARPLPPNSGRWQLGRCTGEGIEWCSGVQNFPSMSRRDPKTSRDRCRSIIPGRPHGRASISI